MTTTCSASRDSGVISRMPSGMGQDLGFPGAGHVAVPAVHRQVQMLAQGIKAAVLVIDQGLQRADVQHFDAWLRCQGR